MTPRADAAGPGEGLLAVLPRVFLATFVANLPMLALLLVPQLMRSRAGSERMLFVGSTAWAAPKAERWTPRTARLTAREIRRSQPREFWRRGGEWSLIFFFGQMAGLAIAWLMPYVWDNPGFGAPGEPRWIIRYGNYFVQVVVIYLFSCLSFAWFGARLRQLAVAR